MYLIFFFLSLACLLLVSCIHVLNDKPTRCSPGHGHGCLRHRCPPRASSPKVSPNNPIPRRSSSRSSPPILRPCIFSSTEGKKREKKKKRVQFAEDVVDPSGDGKEYRRQHDAINSCSSYSSSSSSATPTKLGKSSRGETRGMPANRVALYNGILRDRGVQRLAYSY
ncbi:uncharacterized protein LOC121248106 [Juglans microcarpa x Juglans regia]|uniref:uncharacterized protein LOC121248106 n=1 Tax=Juglans microcarpa x Juglans regia TaxID=2249226 RepID=UPI001B7F0D9E|nr:uncharacterized protein LOC121248106 [Juglans microcarpa x Juglans regia]